MAGLRFRARGATTIPLSNREGSGCVLSITDLDKCELLPKEEEKLSPATNNFTLCVE